MKKIRSNNIFLVAIFGLCSSLSGNTINTQEFNLNSIKINYQKKTDPTTLSLLIGFFAGFTAVFVETNLPKNFRPKKSMIVLIKHELDKNKIKHNDTYYYLSNILGNIAGSVAANYFKEKSKQEIYFSIGFEDE